MFVGFHRNYVCSDIRKIWVIIRQISVKVLFHNSGKGDMSFFTKHAKKKKKKEAIFLFSPVVMGIH